MVLDSIEGGEEVIVVRKEVSVTVEPPEGIAVLFSDGEELGTPEGRREGHFVGQELDLEGWLEGAEIGILEGNFDGEELGELLNKLEASSDG